MKTKVFIKLVIAGSLLCCVCACNVIEIFSDGQKLIVDYTKNSDLFEFNKDNELVLKAGAVVPESVVIPLSLEVEGKKVTVQKLSNSLFKNCTSLKSVHVSSNIENIESKTFEACTNLETVILDNGVKSVQEDAFFGCESLNLIWTLSQSEYVEIDISNVESKGVSLKGSVRIVGQED